MIATLEGLVSGLGLNSVVLDVGGVGYGLFIAIEDHERLTLGQKVKFFIYEQVREQSFDLYGFTAADTKQLFEQLLSVKNVGPKVALAVLDIGPASKVRAAIAGGDIKVVQAAKGVGKRAAEQIIVELRDKVGYVSSETAEGIARRPGILAADEAAEALISLGYTPQDAAIALQKVDPSLPTEERIREALKG